MKAGSLFSGYGGLDLALARLGNGVVPQRAAAALRLLLADDLAERVA